MFKIETHLHTKTSSGCGTLSADEIIEGYHAAGYSGICVTDHYLRYYFDTMGVSDLPVQLRLDKFLRGYSELQEVASKYGIRIYKGAELRFDESENDYLLYGWPEWLLRNPDEIFSMGLHEFYPVSHNAGAVLIQAHPFRSGSVISDLSYLDGIEIYNAHPRHNNHNEKSQEVALQCGRLICVSGSDCHRTDDIGRGGIIVDHIPDDEFELADILRRKSFSCIIP